MNKAIVLPIVLFVFSFMVTVCIILVPLDGGNSLNVKSKSSVSVTKKANVVHKSSKRVANIEDLYSKYNVE